LKEIPLEKFDKKYAQEVKGNFERVCLIQIVKELFAQFEKDLSSILSIGLYFLENRKNTDFKQG